jgi:hypothetical protein
MFKPFLLKLCSIPATLFPLAIMYSLGYQPPIHFIIQPQPERIKMFCSLLTVLVPFILSSASTILKFQFKLISSDQIDMIHEAIVEFLFCFYLLIFVSLGSPSPFITANGAGPINRNILPFCIYRKRRNFAVRYFLSLSICWGCCRLSYVRRSGGILVPVLI